MNPQTSTLTVQLGARSYPIYLTPELPSGRLRELAAQALGPKARKLLLVSDSNVAPLYGADVVAGLEAAGYSVELLVLPAGEASKSLTTVSAVVDKALACGISRRDGLVALGGGVVGDITGFSAAILNRGVPFIQVPTSLLAQVDSSVGGKTGVNHAAGKNLIGAFWQPRAVIASQAVLKTLPPREVRCGLAEALKHGMIADARWLDLTVGEADAIVSLDPVAAARLVRRCCEIKAAVVAEDERESGRRAILNFGHTLGHAYERLLGYGVLTHGEAVALGMVLAARVSVSLGCLTPIEAAKVAAILSRFGLPVDPKASGLPSLMALLDAARSDKKASADGVVFVALGGLGRAELRFLRWPELAHHLGASLDPGDSLEDLKA